MNDVDAEKTARAFLGESGTRNLELLSCRHEHRPGRPKEWCVMFKNLDAPVGWDNNEVWVEIDDETGVPRLFPML